MVGLRLHIHPVARDALIYLGISSGQLVPNGWRYLMGCISLWPQVLEYELTLQEFFWTHWPLQVHGKAGFFSLGARQGRKIIFNCPSNNKGWNKKFFQVFTLGLREKAPGIQLRTSWAGKLRMGAVDLPSLPDELQARVLSLVEDLTDINKVLTRSGSPKISYKPQRFTVPALPAIIPERDSVEGEGGDPDGPGWPKEEEAGSHRGPAPEEDFPGDIHPG